MITSSCTGNLQEENARSTGKFQLAPSYNASAHYQAAQPIQLFNFLRFSHSAVAFSRVFRWRDSAAAVSAKNKTTTIFNVLIYIAYFF